MITELEKCEMQAQRIRLDDVRNEPSSEPFVGQARFSPGKAILHRKYLFQNTSIVSQWRCCGGMV